MSTAAFFRELELAPGLVLKNRFVLASLTRNRNIVPGEINAEYYTQRSGAGLILSEGTLIESLGSEWPEAPGLWSDKQVDGWKKVTDAVHANGSKIFAQLWHIGRVAHKDMPLQEGKPVISASDVAARGGKFRQLPGEPGYHAPVAVKDPWTIVALFQKASENAKKAGFDGVELHSANGYLISQFLESGSNKRTDEWGGSVEKRTKFGIEVLKAIQKPWPSFKHVGIKTSPGGGYNDMGLPVEEMKEQYGYYYDELDKLGLAYIQIARYAEAMDPKYDGELRGTKHDPVELWNPHIKNTPIFYNSGFGQNPAEGAKWIEEGKAAAIVFGTGFLGNPDLPERIKQGKELNWQLDFPTFYNSPEGDKAKGYTTYPTAT